jgi:hypothetical protein
MRKTAFDVMMIGLMLFCAAFIIDGEAMGFVTSALGFVGILGLAVWLPLTTAKMLRDEARPE